MAAGLPPGGGRGILRRNSVVRAQAQLSQVEDEDEAPELRRRALVIAAVLAGLALAAYIADVALHPLIAVDWYDLHVYNDAGLIARHTPATLYTWRLIPQIGFTYPPFAAMIFAAGSLLPWAVLAWLTTTASVLAVPLTAWLTAAALLLSAAALWAEPVQRALHLGQIELLLLLLIVWDLCQPDRRWWKGAGVGLAAGMKLVPLIFIPYLLLAGKLRQAAAATAAFAITVGIGYAWLPRESNKWWLTGYFLGTGRIGDLGQILNQSGFAMLIRLAGSQPSATPLWWGAAAAVAVVGLAAAALLHQSGRPVHGWAMCALTGLLISPVSWDHHWVWILPFLAILADLAVRASGAARLGYLAVAVALFAVFSDVGARGLLGFYPTAAETSEVQLHGRYRLHGVQVISWNLFVLAGLVFFVLALCFTWRTVIAGPAPPAGRPSRPAGQWRPPERA
jgi:alpha-1,2-mannosyltransferase